MPALEDDRPTALERKGNTTVCCISPVIYRGIGGWINTSFIKAAKFHAAHPEDVSPRDYADKVSDCSVTLSFKMQVCCRVNKRHEHEQELGRARYLLDAFLGPLCIEESNATNLRHHEHTKYKGRSATENIVFVLPNKHAVLRDLHISSAASTASCTTSSSIKILPTGAPSLAKFWSISRTPSLTEQPSTPGTCHCP
jgi:hypothetical protein